MVRRSWRRKNL